MPPPVITGLLVGALGAWIATLLHIAAPALVGSAIATSVICMRGFRFALPRWLTTLAFSMVGIAMGSSVTQEVLQDIDRWLVSLAVLLVCIVTIMVTNTMLLTRVFRWDRKTAILASAPGALSTVVALASEGHGDATRVAVVQSMRLALITLALPIAGLFIAIPPSPYGSGGGWQAVALLVPAYAIGWGLLRLKVPTAHLLSALILAAIAYGSGWVTERPANWFTTFGFVVIGTMIGSRFSGVGMRKQVKSLLAGLAVTWAGALVALAFAVLAIHIAGIDGLSAAIAYAPGGVEAMGAVAVALHSAPALVAAHHLFRILVVSFGVPLLFTRLR